MKRSGLSNRERRKLGKLSPAKPRRDAAVRATAADRAKAASARGEPAAETVRDGLAWLLKKRRIRADQHREAMRFRLGFQQVKAGAAIPSSANIGTGSGGMVSGRLLPVEAGTAAVLEVETILTHVLKDQPDMVTAMEGVAGHGYTLRQLAMNDQMRSVELEIALYIALDLVIEWRREKSLGAAA
ncbi:MAG: hypothetical protein KIS90_00725 [Phenylobacterium sp.]|nr:hypothetical protein [Phenylobacterium sp.]